MILLKEMVWVFAAGIALSLLYFGSARLTAALVPRVSNPPLAAILGLGVRVAGLLACARVIVADEWLRAPVCVAGIIAARLLVLEASLTRSTEMRGMLQRVRHIGSKR